jgi:hypothetical protein
VARGDGSGKIAAFAGVRLEVVRWHSTCGAAETTANRGSIEPGRPTELVRSTDPLSVRFS